MLDNTIKNIDALLHLTNGELITYCATRNDGELQSICVLLTHVYEEQVKMKDGLTSLVEATKVEDAEGTLTLTTIMDIYTILQRIEDVVTIIKGVLTGRQMNVKPFDN